MKKSEKDEKYEAICKKLGFIPSELKDDDGPATEDDNHANPFSVLTAEEKWYLYNNGYLTKSN